MKLYILFLCLTLIPILIESGLNVKLGVKLPSINVKLPQIKLPSIAITTVIRRTKSKGPIKLRLPEISLDAEPHKDDWWEPPKISDSWSAPAKDDWWEPPKHDSWEPSKHDSWTEPEPESETPSVESWPTDSWESEDPWAESRKSSEHEQIDKWLAEKKQKSSKKRKHGSSHWNDVSKEDVRSDDGGQQRSQQPYPAYPFSGWNGGWSGWAGGWGSPWSWPWPYPPTQPAPMPPTMPTSGSSEKKKEDPPKEEDDS